MKAQFEIRGSRVFGKMFLGGFAVVEGAALQWRVALYLRIYVILLNPRRE